jgi:general stress protein 26
MLLNDVVTRFVDEHRDVVLFCRDARGDPIGYPMRTTACDAKRLIFTTYRKSAKVRNLERDARVCVYVPGTAPEQPRWTSITGIARVVAPSASEIDAMFPARSDEPRVPAGMAAFVKQRLREGKRILVEVDQLESPGILS